MKQKRFFSIALVLAILLTVFSMPATAVQTEPSSILVKDASKSILSILDAHEISYNQDSVIRIVNRQGCTYSTENVSALYVQTEIGNRVECSTLLSFSRNQNGDVVQDDFGKAVFQQARDGSTNENIWQGTRIKAVTVFDSYNDRQYNRAYSEYFTCFNYNNGVRPSRVFINTTLVGDLYSKNGTTYTKLQENYEYTNPYTVYSPAFNTMYSHDKAMATNRVVEPYSGINGFSLYVSATINGTSYEWDSPVYV